MIDKEKLLNLIEIYLDIENDDIEDVNSELEAAGIDPEKSEKKTLELIKRAKAELKIEKGKRLKEEFYNFSTGTKEKINVNELNNPELAIAFRKLEENGSPDLLDDNEKMLILEYINRKKDIETN